jgi:hypothetical protein
MPRLELPRILKPLDDGVAQGQDIAQAIFQARWLLWRGTVLAVSVAA